MASKRKREHEEHVSASGGRHKKIRIHTVKEVNVPQPTHNLARSILGSSDTKSPISVGAAAAARLARKKEKRKRRALEKSQEIAELEGAEVGAEKDGSNTQLGQFSKRAEKKRSEQAQKGASAAIKADNGSRRSASPTSRSQDKTGGMTQNSGR